jgi:hypothetical protein
MFAKFFLDEDQEFLFRASSTIKNNPNILFAAALSGTPETVGLT